MEILSYFDPTVYISLAFLFGIAAQFMAMDGSTFLKRLVSAFAGKVGILYATVIITAIFSPLILNDIVVLILTPVLIGYSKKSNIDIAPLLVAEVTFTNIASSLTPLGNPQNILLWQSSGISFHNFIEGTWLPLLVSGVIAGAFLFAFRQSTNTVRPPTPDLSSVGSRQSTNTILSQVEARRSRRSIYPGVYLGSVACILLGADLLTVPNYLAMGFAFLLGFLFSFRSVGTLKRLFDFRSLGILYLLIAAVSVVAFFIEPVISPFVVPAAHGVQPYSAIFLASLSNIVSNVPATQLLIKAADIPPDAAPQIAVEAGLAGNIGPISSFALLLSLLIVKKAGLKIRKIMVLQIAIGIISFLPALFLF